MGIKSIQGHGKIYGVQSRAFIVDKLKLMNHNFEKMVESIDNYGLLGIF